MSVVDRLLAQASALARPAVSGFRVGAVTKGASGRLYLGANLEFPGHGLAATVHAEQAAIANAWANGETGVQVLAVTAAPCGYCRQFLYELRSGGGLKIAVGTSLYKLSTLLPRAFGPGDLGVQVRLMEDAGQHNLSFASPAPVDNLGLAAFGAANTSYAPYTGTYGGVALELDDGSVYTGRTIENAAYNPGLPPLQGALVALAMDGKPFAAIQRAALAEATGQASHHDATVSVLSSLAPAAGFTYLPLVAL